MWHIVDDGVMVWRFVALAAGTQSEYLWRWLCENERGEVEMRSAKGYAFFYDCLEDARRHGYGARAPGSQAGMAAGGLVGSWPGGAGAPAPRKKEQAR